MKVTIYIGEDNRKVDLFNDENITLTVKSGDVEKLSSVFTDFSNTFTIPATPNNNAIFEHYYDFDIDGTFNAATRIVSFIELDSFQFKSGKIQLESVSLKNSKPISYKITFYGSLTQLTDLFGNDSLQDLTGLTALDYTYNETNFYRTLNDSTFLNGDVICPLIQFSNKNNVRDWNFLSGDVYDVTTTTAAIKDYELRPAIRLESIIEQIEAKYGLEFSRDFFGSATFKNLFMTLNNITDDFYNNPIVGEQTRVLDITSKIGTEVPWVGTNVSTYYFDIDEANDTVKLAIGNNYHGNNYPTTIYSVSPTIIPEAGYTTVPYRVDIYINNILYYTGSTVTGSYTVPDKGITSLYDSVQFKISSTQNLRYKTTFTYTINKHDAKENTWYHIQVVQPEINFLSQRTIEINKHIHSIKIIDFISGLMKMFKLVIRPFSSTSFYVDTMNRWYGKGKVIDLTKYVDISSLEVSRPTIYKTLIFKYQNSENILNKKFREELNDPTNKEIGYGDLKAEINYIDNKEELKIELPFENMLFERFGAPGSSSFITIGQCITSSDGGITFSQNKSKPIIFYNNGLVPEYVNPVYFEFDGAGATSQEYVYSANVSNNILQTQVTDSLNFKAEFDPFFTPNIVESTLYDNYWRDWIETIYDRKQRKVALTAWLPPRLIRELSLNDRIVIDGNRWKIDDYTINLVSGEVKFNLLKDIYGFGATPPEIGKPDYLFTKAKQSADVYLNISSPYSVSLINTGDGTSWLTYTLYDDRITFTVVHNTGSTRIMKIRFTILGVDTDITIFQAS